MATKQKMTVWFDLVDRDLRPRAIDGQEIADWQNGPKMQDYLRHLFKEGWQIVKQINPGTIIFERDLQ